MQTFNEADKVVHPVEAQWHYKILEPLGWIAQTKEAVGFVRSYVYTHPESDSVIQCRTGVHADTWEEITYRKHWGYWPTLAKFAIVG
mgnify:CR=1 FL=1